MSDFFRLINKLGILRKYIILLILRSPFDAARTWMLAGLMRSFFSCIETGLSEKLLTLGAVYGLICALLFLYNGTIWSIYAAFAAKVEAFLQKKVIEKILSMPLRRIDSSCNGDWLTRLNSDIQTAIVIMNAPVNVPHLVVATINTLVASLLLLECNIILFLGVCVSILPYLFINYRIVLKRVPELKRESINAISENTASIEPLITEGDAILIYEAENLMLKRCEESSQRLMRINMRIHVRKAISDALGRIFGSCGYLGILMIGYIMISKGAIVFPDVVYSLQIRYSMIMAMTLLIDSWNNIRINSVCVKRLNDMFEE